MKILMMTEKVIVEPLGLLYLATPLIRAGHIVDIIQVDKEHLHTFLKLSGPYDIFCFSVITGNESRWSNVSVQAKILHKRLFGREPRSIFGGPHCTFDPHGMGSMRGVDAVVQGEAEGRICEIVTAESWGEWAQWPIEPFEDINSIEHPTRSILYDRYEGLRNNSIHNFISERGCPHHCTFCYNHAWNQLHKGMGKLIRVRDPEDVAHEIIKVKRDYPEHFRYPWFVCDHFFGGQKPLVDRFRRAFSEACQGLKLPIFCSLRADQMDEEMVQLLKYCQVYTINMALEAANDDVRNNILKKNLQKEEVVKALQLCKKYGIHVRLQNIIGLPVPRALDDAFETLAFNYEHCPTISWSSILQPYKGTEIATYAQEHGYVPKDASVPGSFFSHSIMKIDHRKEIDRLHKWWPVLLNRRKLYALRKLLVRLPIPMRLLTKMWAKEKALQDDKLFKGASHG